MKLTLTNVTRTPRTSQRTGKDYTQLTLKSVEYGEKFINGFGNKANMAWKAGDVVDVEVKEVPKDGKTYLNFEMKESAKAGGSFTQTDRDTLTRLEISLEQIKTALKQLTAKEITADDMPYPDNNLGEPQF